MILFCRIGRVFQKQSRRIFEIQGNAWYHCSYKSKDYRMQSPNEKSIFHFFASISNFEKMSSISIQTFMAVIGILRTSLHLNFSAIWRGAKKGSFLQISRMEIFRKKCSEVPIRTSWDMTMRRIWGLELRFHDSRYVRKSFFISESTAWKEIIFQNHVEGTLGYLIQREFREVKKIDQNGESWFF